MTKQNIKTKEGFTIIEVVLVLAIAGLIFLMVFVALPALQRSQRDTARRNDMSRLSTALTNYQTNNNNNLPADASWDDDDTGGTALTGCSGEVCKFIAKYLHGAGDSVNTFTDPDGSFYEVTFDTYDSNAYAGETSPVPTTFSEHVALVVKGAKCDGEEAAAASGTRQFAIFYRLEGAGTYCVDNQ